MGGLPTPGVDIPVVSVFICLYLIGAVFNMTFLQRNLKRGHKFLISGALFGFCMARTATCVLRIAWATRQHNVRLAMAASIFVNAGILIVYVVNIIFAQRILRAKQPQIGWNPVFRNAFHVLYVLIGVVLAMVITSIVLSAYSLNANVHRICRDLQLAAITYLFIFTTLPWFCLAAAYLLPRSSTEENFGHGSMQKKAIINFLATCVCVIISGFKTGTAWMPPRPITNPAWFDSKAAFYVFNFSFEIVLLILFISTRIDKRFHVPDGSKAPGDYTKRQIESVTSSPKESLEADTEVREKA